MVIDQIACVATANSNRWSCTWTLSNCASATLHIVEAWLPHGRFRGEGRVALGVTVEPGATASISLEVRAEEPRATVVENAFLILRTHYEGEEWRLFARLSVEFDPQPRPRCVLITTQRLH